MNGPPYIKGAAVKLSDGRVITAGRSHGSVFHKMKMERVDRMMAVQGEQGFVTGEGKFVTRKEAAEIALDVGQVTKLRWPSYGLNSEDLW